jgi:hypothetical protein
LYTYHLAAFSGAANTLWPPVLGQQSVRWSDVFPLIHQPDHLWDLYKPSQTLENMDLNSIWVCWTTGESVLDANSDPSGMKPPLRDVEQHFGSTWRKGPQVTLPFLVHGVHSQPWIISQARKAWQRFREIPEWIDAEVRRQAVPPEEVIRQLELLRAVPGKPSMGMNALSKHVKALREAIAVQSPLSLASVVFHRPPGVHY